MIEAGASVIFAKDTLLAACATNHNYDYPKIIEISELIISRGVDINQTLVDEELDSVSGYTALMWAANRGKKPLVELLLNNGASVNIQSKRGDTALTTADPEHLEIVKLLLDSGANPDLINDQDRNAVSELLWQAEALKDASLGFSANLERAKLYIKMASFIQKYK
ncbi:MAG: ankyrin repeat domain-containing protein [Cyanobacteria bacterium P01_G01_bin.67]